jgi:hypothetical protein
MREGNISQKVRGKLLKRKQVNEGKIWKRLHRKREKKTKK